MTELKPGWTRPRISRSPYQHLCRQPARAHQTARACMCAVLSVMCLRLKVGKARERSQQIGEDRCCVRVKRNEAVAESDRRESGAACSPIQGPLPLPLPRGAYPDPKYTASIVPSAMTFALPSAVMFSAFPSAVRTSGRHKLFKCYGASKSMQNMLWERNEQVSNQSVCFGATAFGAK